ncbi:hypothetical protein PoB_001748400 [Plakobranchus ocellatus]|uniref:Uncharacterized protein n=1 Tax=Plakobranchus ocellatus TaxID=259542 RepID=A0AAV3Z982_9GAST|nr:hypothetical protein PoB_001748400 [Plakobranchus ocellatus]
MWTQALRPSVMPGHLWWGSNLVRRVLQIQEGFAIHCATKALGNIDSAFFTILGILKLLRVIQPQLLILLGGTLTFMVDLISAYEKFEFIVLVIQKAL